MTLSTVTVTKYLYSVTSHLCPNTHRKCEKVEGAASQNNYGLIIINCKASESFSLTEHVQFEGSCISPTCKAASALIHTEPHRLCSRRPESYNSLSLSEDSMWVLCRSPSLSLLQLLTEPLQDSAAILSVGGACAALLADPQRRPVALQLLDSFVSRGRGGWSRQHAPVGSLPYRSVATKSSTSVRFTRER